MGNLYRHHRHNRHIWENIIFRCEKICKFQNQGYTESTLMLGTANVKDVVKWGLGLMQQQALCGYG